MSVYERKGKRESYLLVELRREHRPERVRRKVAEAAVAPMDILTAPHPRLRNSESRRLGKEGTKAAQAYTHTHTHLQHALLVRGRLHAQILLVLGVPSRRQIRHLQLALHERLLELEANHDVQGIPGMTPSAVVSEAEHSPRRKTGCWGYVRELVRVHAHQARLHLVGPLIEVVRRHVPGERRGVC